MLENRKTPEDAAFTAFSGAIFDVEYYRTLQSFKICSTDSQIVSEGFSE